jgi:phosphatidylserine/phosphatidylglycerophosphate/cardiolipin synthase-like enzyme
MTTRFTALWGARAAAAITVILCWQACSRDEHTYYDMAEDRTGDTDGVPDIGPDGLPDMPPDGDADALPDLVPDGDVVTEPDAEVWECGCPETPIQTCGTVESVAFSTWDSSLMDQLFGAFACARYSLDISIYDAEWSCLIDALLDAKEARPALRIRVVTDNYTCGDAGALTCDLRRLVDAGAAEVVPDNRSYLMHHKLVIVDAGQTDQWALVGSTNWTFQSFCEDYNGGVVVDDQAIVDGLYAEFERMFGGDFGDTPWTEPISSSDAALYFSPPGVDWQEAIISELGALSSGATVRFMNYSFTRLDMAEALVQAHGRGVDVRGLTSRMFASETAVANMLDAGIPVRKAFVHHKVLIFDTGSQQTVVTGSGNYSTNARDNNNEIVVFFWNDPEMYSAYFEEFNRIQAIAEDI